ncbi:DUF58 domain-containing protein [Methylomarinum sp. Ch1-1]|uniref:DUF58 domain-containing protein n=1 Tax=Methylomarinum roseum TaxID=3067653 RepID=A0AAU7NVW9_9GAMM|nr:DUF58 domain-containing protein [Methylomarinum sp. Ch1-1]MDP4522780.1 DUF58 domain-containing protein [Methylomarinum sp. Ch1-1]
MSETALSLTERFQRSRFMSGEKPIDRPLTLNHRRIFILPTLRGMGFVLLIALLLLIAFVYNNNLAYLLAFLLASVFFVTILHSYKSLAGLVIQAGHSHAAFAGEAAGFTLHISNPVQQSRINLQLSMQSQQNISLADHEQTTVTLYAAAHKRGWLACDTVTVSSCYPLGLFRAWSPLRFNLQALVYPHPANAELPFPETGGLSGEQDRGPKDGDDFYGIKSYQGGDPIRQIHWKAFAKGQGLFSKEYAGAATTECWLDYQATPGHDLEQRLSQLCRWVVDAEQAGIRYGLILPGTRTAPSHGRQHYTKCLETLALF